MAESPCGVEAGGKGRSGGGNSSEDKDRLAAGLCQGKRELCAVETWAVPLFTVCGCSLTPSLARFEVARSWFLALEGRWKVARGEVSEANATPGPRRIVKLSPGWGDGPTPVVVSLALSGLGRLVEALPTRGSVRFAHFTPGYLPPPFQG